MKFLKSPEGIIPSLCRTLTELRKQVKREMKNLPKDDAYARGILNSKQLALKLTSYSLYGSMGFSKGLLFHSDAAQAVTAKGRKLIHSMRDMIVDRYGGREIYGDTDSTMVVVSKKHAWDQASCVALGNTIEKWINGEASPDRPQLGSNITVEFEKAMTMLAIKNTKYCAYFYDPTCATKYLKEKGGDSDDPSGSTPALYHRGTILKRRDSVEVARKMYEKVVRMALSGRSKTDVLLQVSLEVLEVFNTDDYSTFVSTMKDQHQEDLFGHDGQERAEDSALLQVRIPHHQKEEELELPTQGQPGTEDDSGVGLSPGPRTGSEQALLHRPQNQEQPGRPLRDHMQSQRKHASQRGNEESFSEQASGVFHCHRRSREHGKRSLGVRQDA